MMIPFSLQLIKDTSQRDGGKHDCDKLEYELKYLIICNSSQFAAIFFKQFEAIRLLTLAFVRDVYDERRSAGRALFLIPLFSMATQEGVSVDSSIL